MFPAVVAPFIFPVVTARFRAGMLIAVVATGQFWIRASCLPAKIFIRPGTIPGAAGVGSLILLTGAGSKCPHHQHNADDSNDP